MSKSSTEEQVREMARLTLLTNRLNPIQEKNLKLYPLVFFNGIISAKVDFDISNDQMVDTTETVEDKTTHKDVKIDYKFNKADTSHLRVSYHLEIDQAADNSQLDKRFEAITRSVRNLLFNETKVQVFINGKLEHEAKNV